MRKEYFFSFDVSSKVAHFRVEYTTTSAFTYPFPTRNNIVGLLGAIGGIKRQHLTKLQKEVKVGVQILTEIRTKTFGLNVQYGKTEVKKGIKMLDPVALWYRKEDGRVVALPVNYEVLLFPAYRIFVKGSGKMICSIFNKLSSEEAYFTPYLGSMFAIARIENFLEFKNYVNLKKGEKVRLQTTAPEKMIEILDFSDVFFVQVPSSFKEPQKASKYERIYYKKTPQEICGRVKGEHVYKVEEESVVALY